MASALIVLTVSSPALAQVALTELVSADAQATKVVGDCKFTEGPIWSPRGYLLFSDIPNDRIVQVMPDGTSKDFLNPSGKANGLAFDAKGNLYLCRGGARNVAMMSDPDTRELKTVAGDFEGKAFNSPNDLALDAHGGLYFTDPRYGDGPAVEQPVMGVYYVAANGTITRIIEDLERPNGVLVSPDGRTLYVAEPNRRELYAYPILSPGIVAAGRLLFRADEKTDGGGPDGMALDVRGNLYATYAGIVVLTPAGDLVGRIPVPERPANCKFGGSDHKTLYITARTSLYSIPMLVEGAALPAVGPLAAAAPKAAPRIQLTGAEEPAAKTKEFTAGNLKLDIPEGWDAKESSRPMRAAEIKVPAVEGDKEAGEIVVFFFGQGGAGGIQANIDRWVGQFEEKGRASKVTAGKTTQGDFTLVELSGTYKKPIGPPIAGQSKPMPGWRVLGAIVSTKAGPYFVKFDGPDKTVTASAKAFRTAIGVVPDTEKPVEKQAE
jgi:gluconolactonase